MPVRLESLIGQNLTTQPETQMQAQTRTQKGRVYGDVEVKAERVLGRWEWDKRGRGWGRGRGLERERRWTDR